ncbi:MAG: preprotein translocase subunit YajC [Acidiferrobacterales bacterium]|nr:preprotein translocase subunit YajC [Acidiferrobacterales bacterium]
MNFFIPDAMAAAPAGGVAGEGGQFLIMMVILFGLMYFMIIRPQSKRAKEHRQMVEALTKGDEVVTNGGTLGRVTKVGDQFVTLEIASGIEIKVQRSAIASVMPKGTIKSA